jgi:hypothetical protein
LGKCCHPGRLRRGIQYPLPPRVEQWKGNGARSPGVAVVRHPDDLINPYTPKSGKQCYIACRCFGILYCGRNLKMWRIFVEGISSRRSGGIARIANGSI